MTKRPSKYGMKANTIRYFQHQAKLVEQMMGYDYAVTAFGKMITADLLRDGYNAAIAHGIIGLAAIDPVRVKLLLSTGKVTY